MRKFGRKKANREHLIKNLVTSVILYERIKTTEPKAKETLSEFDKIINIAKINNLSSRRRLNAYFTDKNAVKKIYEVLLPKFENTKSGFAKIYRTGFRVGDGAPKVIIMLSGDNSKEINQPDTNANNKNDKKE